MKGIDVIYQWTLRTKQWTTKLSQFHLNMESPNERSLQNCWRKYKEKRISDKRQKDLKATVKLLENGIKALLGNLTEVRPSKVCYFWQQKIYRIKEKKDKDRLVYARKWRPQKYSQSSS